MGELGMRNHKRLLVGMVLLSIVIMVSACNAAQYAWGDIKSKLDGRQATIETFDEDSQLIDHIEGKSVDISTEDAFSTSDKDGNTVKKSGVLNITIGGKQMLHVGSSLILRENGLTDRFREFTQRVDIKNFDNSTPIISRMVNDFKNATTGGNKLLLIRSQSGTPLAAYSGNDVSFFATESDKATAFLIDDKLLFVYRCDYTLYDTELLKK
jgi:hypothetical protein